MCVGLKHWDIDLKYVRVNRHYVCTTCFGDRASYDQVELVALVLILNKRVFMMIIHNRT